MTLDWLSLNDLLQIDNTLFETPKVSFSVYGDTFDLEGFEAIAGRSMPGRVLRTNREIATSAPVLPALTQAGAPSVRVSTRLSPPWTTDWIAPQGKEKLRRYGIAPPGAVADDHARPVTFVARIDCPLCGSGNTERLSQFGARACKALYRCIACREPFEYFKPI